MLFWCFLPLFVDRISIRYFDIRIGHFDLIGYFKWISCQKLSWTIDFNVKYRPNASESLLGKKEKLYNLYSNKCVCICVNGTRKERVMCANQICKFFCKLVLIFFSYVIEELWNVHYGLYRLDNNLSYLRFQSIF